jgi:hypothetical protein
LFVLLLLSALCLLISSDVLSSILSPALQPRGYSTVCIRCCRLLVLLVRLLVRAPSEIQGPLPLTVAGDLIAELSNWKLQDGLIHPCPCCTSDGSKDHAASRLMLPPAVRAPAEGERSVPLHRAGAGTGRGTPIPCRGASGGQHS